MKFSVSIEKRVIVIKQSSYIVLKLLEKIV